MLIEVLAGAGDDRVTANLQQPPEPEFVFRADLGGGNNIFDAVLQNPPDPERQMLIEVLTGAGNDRVTANLVNPPEPDRPGEVSPPEPEFVFRAHLGGGDNRLDFVMGSPGLPGETPPPEPDRQALIDVTVGAGNDQVNVTFYDIFANTDVQVDLGAGNDTFQGTVAVANLGGASGPAPMQVDPGNFSVSIDVLGRAGDDVLGLLVGGPGPSPEAYWLNSDLAVNFDGGYGEDTALIAIINTAVNGSVMVHAEGGAGADTGSIIMEGGTVAAGASLEVSTNGGGGGDALSIGGIMPCWLPGSRGRIALAGDGGNDTIGASLAFPDPAGGEVGIIIIGGFGDDDIRADIMPCALPGGVVDVTIAGDDGNDVIAATLRDAHVDGQFNLNVTGGGGTDDLFIGGFMPCADPEARSSIHLAGDGGNDIIRGDLQLDSDSRGLIDIIFEGGLGDDDLTLMIAGIGDFGLVNALVDGGAGYDVAHVTRGVRVENCEEVFLVG